ncbi:hypothetical protein [Novosphingobium sp.]|jgi:uncharacterized membrane protein|uniref:DUF4870 family protein n=1 Tax=Novosphingobium sp. TaxID=1874826 RepID=UPI0025CBAE1E|nr:hypothetical protein [Novosphingobium sp.]
MTDAVPPTPPPSPTPPPATSGGFDMNRPTIISLLYLSSFVLGITALIGVILAFVWKGEPHEEWEATHYQYLINTFWIGLVGTIVGVVTMIVLIGFLILMATVALCIVRSVLSLINAQKRMAMPNPSTLLA